MGVFPFQGKTHVVEPGIESGTSWLVARSSDHQATRLVASLNIHAANFKLKDYTFIEVTGKAGRCKVDENIGTSLPTDCFITTNAIWHSYHQPIKNTTHYLKIHTPIYTSSTNTVYSDFPVNVFFNYSSYPHVVLAHAHLTPNHFQALIIFSGKQ